MMLISRPLFFLLASALFVVLALANDQTYSNPTSFRKAILTSHNKYRSQHSSPPLNWNAAAAAAARNHARKCKFQHSGGSYGENLAMGFATSSAAVKAWGDERKDYNFAQGEFSSKTGHFTQMVWKSTETVGCGAAKCEGMFGWPGKSWILVCNYWSRGNVSGQYKKNVLPRK